MIHGSGSKDKTIIIWESFNVAVTASQKVLSI
jgi:hypothetical protein